MKCNIGQIIGLIVGAMLSLVAAIAIAYLWSYAFPLFIAAGLVAGVAFGFIPAIKNDLLACPESCSITSMINTLSQAAITLSFISFLVAGVLQVAALSFLSSWFLAWIGVGVAAAVSALVSTGIGICGIVILLFTGLLTQVLANQKCLSAPQQT